MKLSSLFGLDRRLRRLRIAAGEGALAAEDRARLLRLAWEEEKARLGLLAALGIVVTGLTTVMVALLSVAVVVHYWDTPQRGVAAWAVALVWLVLWLVAVVGLALAARGSARGFAMAQREFQRDWAWARQRMGGKEPHRQVAAAAARTETREELLARIARQRERIATLQGDADLPPDRTPPRPRAGESLGETAARLARAHPLATAVLAAGVVVVVKPRRLLRMGAWLAPILWRMRG